MQFSVTAFVLSLAATVVVADMHSVAMCVNNGKGGTSNYNSAATIAACKAYHARNTGSKAYDTCPDCVMDSTKTPPVCYSAATHMGGDEITSYCKDNGADNALT